MKKINNRNVKNMIPKAETALIGTTGMTVIGAAAVGVAGYLLWKNRDSILNFVGQYVDLPESLDRSEHEDFDSEDAEDSTSSTASSKFDRQQSSTL